MLPAPVSPRDLGDVKFIYPPAFPGSGQAKLWQLWLACPRSFLVATMFVFLCCQDVRKPSVAAAVAAAAAGFVVVVLVVGPVVALLGS